MHELYTTDGDAIRASRAPCRGLLYLPEACQHDGLARTIHVALQYTEDALSIRARWETQFDYRLHVTLSMPP
jgi:hypothetical protein